MPTKHTIRRLVTIVLPALILAGLAASAHSLKLSAQGVIMEASSSSSETGLPACDVNETLFPAASFEHWNDTYRQSVENVIDAHMNGSGLSNISCTDDAQEMASGALQSLASSLPQWKGKTIHEGDIYAVLLDYLDAYGCAVKWQLNLIVPQLQQNAASAQEETNIGTLTDQNTTLSETMKQNVDVARRALNRAFTLLSGSDRFRPLGRSFSCLMNASKDLRNDFGLVVEGTQCLPARIWDARATLRILPASSSSLSAP